MPPFKFATLTSSFILVFKLTAFFLLVTLITFFHNPKSFLISSFTVLRYLIRLLFSTNGTDQNCFVFVHLFSFHPNTKVYTPITSLNLTEFRYSVITGSFGAPCVIYVLTFLSLRVSVRPYYWYKLICKPWCKYFVKEHFKLRS